MDKCNLSQQLTCIHRVTLKINNAQNEQLGQQWEKNENVNF